MSDSERARLVKELKRAFDAARGAQAGRPVRHSTAQAVGSISFTLPLLRAVLEGRKTVTRRPMRPQPVSVRGAIAANADGKAIVPAFVSGDRLWIREKWGRVNSDQGPRIVYALDGPAPGVRWMASRFMPRAAARYFVEVTRVRVTRLVEIDDAEAIREGVDAASGTSPRASFIALWDSIYGETEFASSQEPWVWVVDFRLDRTTS